MTKNSNDPRLTAYALGELSAREARALERRLARDSQARGEVQAVRETAALLQRELAAEPPLLLTADQRERIAAAARASAPAALRTRTWPRLLLYGSAAAAACLCLALWLRRESPGTRAVAWSEAISGADERKDALYCDADTTGEPAPEVASLAKALPPPAAAPFPGAAAEKRDVGWLGENSSGEKPTAAPVGGVRFRAEPQLPLPMAKLESASSRGAGTTTETPRETRPRDELKQRFMMLADENASTGADNEQAQGSRQAGRLLSRTVAPGGPVFTPVEATPSVLLQAIPSPDGVPPLQRTLAQGNAPAPHSVDIGALLLHFAKSGEAAEEAKRATVTTIQSELADCPWNPNNRLLRLDIRQVTPAPQGVVEVVFNPERVRAYARLGNGVQKAATQDAADGRERYNLVALYELVPAGIRPTTPHLARAQSALTVDQADAQPELLRIRIPANAAADGQAVERVLSHTPRQWREASATFRQAAAVAAFGLILQHAPNVQGFTLEQVAGLVTTTQQPAPDNTQAAAFLALLQQARALPPR